MILDVLHQRFFVEPETNWTVWLPIIVSVFAVLLTVVGIWFAKKQIAQVNKHHEDVMLQNQTHNELSVRPFLDVTIDYEVPTGHLEFSIDNLGIGPCILKTIQLSYSSEIIEEFSRKNVLEFLNHILLQNSGLVMPSTRYVSFTEISGHAIMNVGDRVSLLKLEHKDVINEGDLRLFFEEIVKVKYIIEYEDFYGNPFTLNVNK